MIHLFIIYLFYNLANRKFEQEIVFFICLIYLKSIYKK